ncbi:MAG: hypothetical protein PW788_14645 [Micavibrio sp.]|nr:hypothetical protein [Micavibrio sp.]
MEHIALFISGILLLACLLSVAARLWRLRRDFHALLYVITFIIKSRLRAHL